MKFNKELILQDKTVVHCKTEEEANQLLNWADSIGLTWDFGSGYLDYNCYSNFKEDTCYNLQTGYYADLDFYKKESYKILEFEDVKFEEKEIITNIIGKKAEFYSNVIKKGTIIAIGQDAIETNEGIVIHPVFVIVLEDGTVVNEYTANCKIIL